MCGIAGIISKSHSLSPEHSKLARLAASIHHRGPDAEGIAIFPGRGFANRRLAIVDIVGGEQPIYNEDGSIGIVYNGEIYNYVELRRILEQHGHVFKTHTDTEVIVHLFEQFGEEAFTRLRGMFAFALWSPESVYLVRDQLGIKPLYIYEDSEKLAFCSEIKGLMGLDDLDWEIDPVGIADYLVFRYTRAPRTVFRRIRKLPAGSFLRIREGKAEQYRYWQPIIQPRPISAKAAIEELRDRLKCSVGSQLIGERAIGLLLSGGLDSSTIAYALHEAGVTVKTFNIGFHDVNEFSYSDAVARKFQLPHWMFVLDQSRMAEYVGHYLRAIDEPIADAACVPLYRLCEEIKNHVTVVVSGEGSDELFAGYPQYRAIAQRFSRPSKAAFEAFLDESYYFRNATEFMAQAVPLELWADGVLGDGSLLDGMLAFDLQTWIPDDLMMKADKILMAHSLEGRFPFLDVDLVEFSFSLPSEYKLGAGNVSKWILREAMRDRLPRECLTRPKMGFTVPINDLLQQCRSSALDLVSSQHPLSHVLNAKKVEQWVGDYYRGRHQQTLQTWVFFVLYRWFYEWNSSRLATATPAEVTARINTSSKGQPKEHLYVNSTIMPVSGELIARGDAGNGTPTNGDIVPAAMGRSAARESLRTAASVIKARAAQGSVCSSFNGGAAPHTTEELYVNLLKKSLTFLLYGNKYLDVREDGEGRIVEARPEQVLVREEGRDWPFLADTMIGLRRLENLQFCVENVLAREVSGDMIECGVWRGGASIFMRGLLKAHNVRDRRVWVADSFRGLPPPNTESYPADLDSMLHTVETLAVSLEEVKENFQRYDLLDEQVRFVEGWFRDTLPRLSNERWAVIRLDGDMYESTMDALTSLYPNLAVGGYVVVDDYGAIPACRQAVSDYRVAHNINDEIHTIDWTGVYWQRSSST